MTDLQGFVHFPPDFRHYISDFPRVSGQTQAEMGEQLGRRRFGRANDPQPQVVDQVTAFDRREHVHAFDARHLFDQVPGAGAHAFGVHPVFKGRPQCQRQEADQDVRLHAVVFLMKNGP